MHSQNPYQPLDTAEAQRYRDEDAPLSPARTWSLDDAAVIEPSEASDEEHFPLHSRAKILERIPLPVRRFAQAVVRWVKGPQPPRPWKIRPLFPAIQNAPVALLDRWCPRKRHRILLLLGFYICWVVTFSSILHASAFAGDVPGYGAPIRVTCNSGYWRGGNGCGLNGDQCRPFNKSTLAFRCPANCKRVEVINPYAVGDQEIVYRPLVIGGPMHDEPGELSKMRYHGSSFICGSAIHSGFINNREGGCGALRLTGEVDGFESSHRNGISSISFNSYFPMSFTFIDGTAAECKDLRWPLLAVSVIYTTLLSLFTTSPAVFFWSTFVAIFFHVALASDPPNLTDYYQLISIALGRFLPAAFCGFVIYKFCMRPQHKGLNAQIEKTVLWLGGCWVGALNNYTFDRIPIQRLTPHDIKQQPGAVPALIIIVLGIFFIALWQAWCIRIEGKLPRYLGIYAIFVIAIVALVAVPRMNLRIHHYILGLVLVPGTFTQTRPSLLFQGLLVGLFINGIARWGFDSILQTPFELRGDAKLGTLLPSVILPPLIHNNIGMRAPANITFEWALPLPRPYDGISVLVNDVERFRGYADRGETSFSWVRQHRLHHHRESVGSGHYGRPSSVAGDSSPTQDSTEGESSSDYLPEYFRFAYLSGSRTADFTRAGVWETDGSWRDMEPGPS